MEAPIPDSFKETLKRQFEKSAEKGGWVFFGGKIIVEVEKKKIGQKQKIKGVTITESIIEI